MECNEVFSISRSTMLGRKHGSNTAGKKEVDRMLWNSPPVGSLQSSVPVSNGQAHRSDVETGSNDTTKQKTTGVKYRAHLQDDDEVLGSPVELCDAAVLKITDATTTSVGSTLPTVSSEVTADSTVMTPPPTPPASVDTVGLELERRRRWLDLCHCDRKFIAIKLFYFTFIGALGVVISFAVVFLKQVGLSPFQIGIISGIRPVLGFVSAPVWGAIADRYNIRRVLMFVSMGAWLVFFSGLYFIEAPTRRNDLSDHVYVGVQATNLTAAPTATLAPNGSMSGTTVDVELHFARQNSSTSVMMYVSNCSNF